MIDGTAESETLFLRSIELLSATLWPSRIYVITKTIVEAKKSNAAKPTMMAVLILLELTVGKNLKFLILPLMVRSRR